MSSLTKFPNSESTRIWLGPILLATVLATLIKLYLALFTAGSADVAGYVDYVAKIHEFGVKAYYYKGPYNNTFNNPPFMIHVLRGLDWLATITNLPFPFWLRLTSTLADVGTIAVMIKIVPKFTSPARATLLLVLLAACPIAIIISGYHGSTASEMVFLVVLSIYLLGSLNRVWLAGAVFGLALNVKISPLMLALAIFLYLPDLKSRMKFFAATAAVFFVGSLPYLLQEPGIILKDVFGYNSIYGNWGWTSLMVRLYPEAPQFARVPFEVIGIHSLFATIGKWIMLAMIVVASVLMNRQKPKPPMFLQCSFIMTIFLALTPGFGSQYVMWLMPWVVILGLWPTIVYYAAGSLYTLMIYTCWAWSASSLFYCEPGVLFYPTLLCWAAVVSLIVFHLRTMRNHPYANV
ncbi:MAG: hypothetical protein ABI596_16805 [Pyrinomonadaceae bacterium]